MQRSVIKELFNFFVAPLGGWQYLDLNVDLNRRFAELDTEAECTLVHLADCDMPGSVESVSAELATSSMADGVDTAAVEAAEDPAPSPPRPHPPFAAGPC